MENLLDFKVTDKLILSGQGGYAYIFSNRVDDNVLGDFKGNNGYIADALLEVGYKVTDKLMLALGGFWEYQKQDKNDKLQNALINEWPENKLISYGGTLRASYKF
ncbi:MAG: hypothetical protein AB1755_03140 [Candidatus Omnitrophota bacterium]